MVFKDKKIPRAKCARDFFNRECLAKALRSDPLLPYALAGYVVTAIDCLAALLLDRALEQHQSLLGR